MVEQPLKVINHIGAEDSFNWGSKKHVPALMATYQNKVGIKSSKEEMGGVQSL